MNGELVVLRKHNVDMDDGRPCSKHRSVTIIDCHHQGHIEDKR